MRSWRRRMWKMLQFLSLLFWTTFCLQFFPMLNCTWKIRRIKFQMKSVRLNRTVATTSREPSLKIREFCTARFMILMKNVMKLQKHFCLKLFWEGEWNCIVDSMASYCMVDWVLILFYTSELLHPKMVIRLRLIRARPNFYLNSINPNVILRTVESSFYTRRIALKDDFQRKKRTFLHILP